MGCLCANWIQDLGRCISPVSVLLTIGPSSFSSADGTNLLFIPFWHDYIKSGTGTISESFAICFGQLRNGVNIELSKEQAEEGNDSYVEGQMKSERPYLVFCLNFWHVCANKTFW